MDQIKVSSYYFFVTIGIYGMGRFGSFWAQSLARSFPGDEVLGYSKNSLPPDGVKKTSLEEVCTCETLFLCTSISSLETVVHEIAGHVGKNTLVADTCSVKHFPTKLLGEVFTDTQPLFATHPMFGPDSGKDDLKDLPIVVYPFGKPSPLHMEWMVRFETMGLKVLKMTPEEHDRSAAVTQGITHLVGRILGEMNLSSHPMSTKGFLSLEEIVRQTCNDPYQLFLDLQRFNPFTSHMRESFMRASEKVLHSIQGIAND